MNYGYWLPPALTEDARNIDALFTTILVITLVALALVLAVLIVAVIRFRRREGRRPSRARGSLRLELAVAAIPTTVLVVLAFMSRSLWGEIRGGGEEGLVIDVDARQFQWDVRYAGSDGRLGTADDVETINLVRVPVGMPVTLRLRSRDVIHSFFVPELRLKQDIVPGATMTYRFTLPGSGNWPIACAELCGLGHYRMMGRLEGLDPAAYAEWYDGRRRTIDEEARP